jgi:hypothetical protein
VLQCGGTTPSVTVPEQTATLQPTSSATAAACDGAVFVDGPPLGGSFVSVSNVGTKNPSIKQV